MYVKISVKGSNNVKTIAVEMGAQSNNVKGYKKKQSRVATHTRHLEDSYNNVDIEIETKSGKNIERTR